MNRRTVLIAAAGICLVVGFVLARHKHPSRGSKAIRITQTAFVAADGRRLSDFFEGLPQDHRVRLQSAPAYDAPACAGRGLLDRLLRHLETTVYGAGGTACPTIPCGGADAAC